MQGVADREEQFKNDFFEDHHGRRGERLYVENFADCNQSDFDTYCAMRKKAAFARASFASTARRARQSVRRAAAAAAKVSRDACLVARAASATALARAVKVVKLSQASPIPRGAPVSQAAQVALQHERRIRKKARRDAIAVLKQARKVAAMLVGRVIEVGVGRVASSVVSGRVVSGKFLFECASASSSEPRRCCCSPKSGTMPRRKRSARKIGSSRPK